MTRKVIIDCDPGIDDAVALCYGLFEPRCEVVAVTATEGRVSAANATRNVLALVEQLDPPRRPRLGGAVALEAPPLVRERGLHGEDGLGNCGLAVAQLHQQHGSDKIICDEIRNSSEPITLVCLGPLTNFARALQRDHSIESRIDQLIIVGGAVRAAGDVTPTAELNVHYDASSAQIVFRSRTTKTLIPLDVTNRVVVTLDFIEQLPMPATRVGRITRQAVSHLFRAFHQERGRESISLQGAVGLIAALYPELLETHEMAGDVETVGDLTLGETVFDRRLNKEWRDNMEVALAIDNASVMDILLRGLHRAV